MVFTFGSTPNYDQWQNLVWNLPMISPKQAAGKITGPASLVTYSPEQPVGTGPYALDAEGYDPTTRVVWKKKATWWAAKQGVAPSPAPNFIIDLCNTSNTNALSGLLTQIEDLNNNYLPGIQGLVSSGAAQTYFSAAPYDLSANIAWLCPNTTEKPLSDKAFRKAVAQSINIDEIVTSDYGNLVLPASPSGLLPIWKKWIDTSLVASKGFKFSTSDAIATLTAAGYTQVGGWFVNKDVSARSTSVSPYLRGGRTGSPHVT